MIVNAITALGGFGAVAFMWTPRIAQALAT
jgi:hypothetical protein